MHMLTFSRALAGLLLGLLPLYSQAGGLLHTWPTDPAPCDAGHTLQNCIDAAGNFDLVRIATNTVNESIAFSKPLGLEGAVGYNPHFTTGHIVTATISAGSVYFNNFTLDQGELLIVHNTGSGSVLISHITVLDTVSNTEGIKISSLALGGLDVDLRYCTVNHRALTNDGAIHGGISINRAAPGAPSGSLSAYVLGNTVTATGLNSYGITGTQTGPGSMTLATVGNTVRGGKKGGIYYFVNNASGSIRAGLVSNAVTSTRPGVNDSGGIELNPLVGSIADLMALNNTVVGAQNGLRLSGSSYTGTAPLLANNLLTANSAGLFVVSAGVTPTLNDNLLYNNGVDQYAGGTGTITTNPLLEYLDQPRLKAGSPAIAGGSQGALNLVESAYAPSQPGSTTALDADGLRRSNGVLDIGAYESGNTSFRQVTSVANTDNSNYSLINLVGLNNVPAAIFHATHNWNANATAGVYLDANFGVFYSNLNSVWGLFNENTVINMPIPVSFDLWKPASGPGSILVTANAGNTSVSGTQLSGISAQDLLLVTPSWNGAAPASAGVYDNHTIEVKFETGSWFIYHPDGTTIPTGASFNLYDQPKSQNAFLHEATAANSVDDYTVIDHPLLNGNYCAQPYITQDNQFSVSNPRPVGVYYTGATWAIFNENEDVIPNHAAFFVLVNPAQTALCDRVFADWFEAQ
jgi:hypothetical protein